MLLNLTVNIFPLIDICAGCEKPSTSKELISKLAISDTPGKKVLVIDEYESIITLNDKVSIFNIIKENNYNRWMPIIIVTNNQHNKHLNEGHFLIDDRPHRNGAGDFKGELIHFGSDKFPNWDHVLGYLLNVD